MAQGMFGQTAAERPVTFVKVVLPETTPMSVIGLIVAQVAELGIFAAAAGMLAIGVLALR